MKKTVKSLIIAASVAAIAGIGAVSFAAWSAGDTTGASANGAAGSIITTGGTLAVTNNNLSDSVKLLPWDQVAQVGSNAKMQTFDVAFTKATNGAEWDSYTYTMTLKDSGTLKLYYQYGTVTGAEDPTAEGTEEAPQNWKELTKDTAVELTLVDGAQTVNIVMVSDNDSYDTDNGQSYTLEISAEAK